MNILFVSAVFPWPLVSGGQVRIYNLLKKLSKVHEITLVSFIREDSEKEFLKNLSFCKEIHVVYRGKARQAKYLLRTALSRHSWLSSTYINFRMRKLLGELIARKRYDVVHIEPFYVFPSLPKLTIPLVVGEHNIEYKIYEGYVRKFPIIPLRPLLSLDVLKLRLGEESVWRRAAAITAVSPEDGKIIAQSTRAPVTVVANGVSLADFPFRPKRHLGDNPTVLFVGNFAWIPNREGCSRLLGEIWPMIKQRFPNASLRIVGRNMPPRLKHRAQAGRATVVGDVASIAKEYGSADVLLAPVGIGGGTKFKMLEAMASGLPVITTSEGMQGLNAAGGVHYLQARAPSEFVMQMVQLVEHPEMKHTMTLSARKLVEKQYTWESIAMVLDTVWKKTYEKNH